MRPPEGFEPGIFLKSGGSGTSAVVAVSTVADGSMLDHARPDDPEIRRNRAAWLERAGYRLEDAARLRIAYDREDYCEYRVVGEAERGEGMSRAAGAPADAYATRTPGLALVLPIADCVGTALWDPDSGWLALAHLGRHSLEQDGGRRVVEWLAGLGAAPERLRVRLSPAPSKASYPIWRLDGMGMKEAVLGQLAAGGVRPECIEDDPAETDLDERYYSHSAYLQGRKPSDGRFAMLAALPRPL